jgi:hypothetical protein
MLESNTKHFGYVGRVDSLGMVCLNDKANERASQIPQLYNMVGGIASFALCCLPLVSFQKLLTFLSVVRFRDASETKQPAKHNLLAHGVFFRESTYLLVVPGGTPRFASNDRFVEKHLLGKEKRAGNLVAKNFNFFFLVAGASRRMKITQAPAVNEEVGKLVNEGEDTASWRVLGIHNDYRK